VLVLTTTAAFDLACLKNENGDLAILDELGLEVIRALHTQFVQTLDRRPIKTRHALRGVEFSRGSSATPCAGERRLLSIGSTERRNCSISNWRA
jgi:hypothetical protein